MKEEYLLTGPLEPTNEPYAVAKIAGIVSCQAAYKQYGLKTLCPMPINLFGTVIILIQIIAISYLA